MQTPHKGTGVDQELRLGASTRGDAWISNVVCQTKPAENLDVHKLTVTWRFLLILPLQSLLLGG